MRWCKIQYVPPKLIIKPSHQCDRSKNCALETVTDLGGLSPREWDLCPCKRGLKSFLARSSMGAHSERSAVCKQMAHISVP